MTLDIVVDLVEGTSQSSKGVLFSAGDLEDTAPY
jgi:hypothetical protein